jgi:hypothetical protein
MTRYLPPTNQFRQLSSPRLLTRASQNADDTFAGAKSLGSLGPGSSAVSFNARGTLSRTDRDDFLKLQILPGAAYSSIANTVTIRGANVRLITSVEIPGAPPQQASAVRLKVGTDSTVANVPFANTFGIPIQIYLQVRRISPNKRVSYNFKVTFNP